MKKAARPKKAAKSTTAKKSTRVGKTPVARATKKASAAKRATPRASAVVARRADYGAPIDGFFAKQPPHLRAILDALRGLVEEAAPEATAALKWGMPVYTLGGNMMCALGGHKSHVNLILAGPPGTFSDPQGRLDGEGKTGRHLTLRALDELPRDAVRGWLRTAVAVARGKA